MKLKLTRSEYKALYAFFNHQILGIKKPQTIEGIMVYSLLMGVYKKLHAKSVEDKKQYSIKLDEHEGIAIVLFFRVFQIPQEMVYEQNLVRNITTSIYQNYAA
jgi:hypothetical protein